MLIRILYTFILYLILPFFLLSLYKSKPNKPRFGKRWKEHFGFTPKLKHTGNKIVWFHTVSVGETIAATPLIVAYHHQYPEHTIVLTTTTSTGAEQAKKLGDIIQHRYMPVDFSWAIKRFIKIIKPTKLFIMETELWPNTLITAKKNKLDITILNARLSNRSFTRYQKIQKIFNLIINSVDQILCQTKDDAQRFIKLGVPSEKVQTTGSLKFDIQISPEVIQSGQSLREDIGKNRPVWVVASTHPGEDEIILEAHQKLLKEIPNLLLILVPRHPERFDTVMQLSQQKKLQTQRRTAEQRISNNVQVYLGDTMGEMLTLIGAADVCFMAGSLIGDKVGGHNLLEPAALAKPCLTGESYYNFKEITEQLLSVQACSICSNNADIYSNVKQLIMDSDLGKKNGEAALKVVNNNRGALQKTLNYL